MPLSDQELNQVSEAILAGNKIQAIKIYREATGLSLSEAKQEIDAITAQLAKDHPELAAAQSKGCLSVFVLGFLCLSAAGILIAQQAG
ncbi:ribosomal protein L7/L12 [Ruficoccus amylovorans]|uniref:Ribosomal protein L7/L12 n=1 Tax=Ruficoccus amylovorans TaxID=1804625 RepID=A0A842HIG3_9BACT|nr:ribosomal protein L7/L12 [Ruficoccus amylovorans]MBC2596149.1 ribosomal protein L7/L12 [Ruficoccus amylovorans]